MFCISTPRPQEFKKTSGEKIEKKKDISVDSKEQKSTQNK